ncbi:MAG TPA: hypothetical protein VNS09_15220 [Solirubrobacter sp.]|nr:hypothetical protein [Solirubrobacter sp.]
MVTQCSEPDWEPLIALVGLDVVGEFMWMGELALEGGLEVHAYKHRTTRRYLHLSVDGRAFNGQVPGRYREWSMREALAEAFTDWDTLVPGAAEPEAVRELLRRHGVGAA